MLEYKSQLYAGIFLMIEFLINLAILKRKVIFTLIFFDMYKNLFRAMLCVVWVLALSLWTINAEFSQIINITWFNASWESWKLIQTFTQNWDDLNIYFLSSTWNISHYIMMDRNLWATQVYNQDYNSPNTWSFWYHYQWWNNYGFESCYENDCNTFPNNSWFISTVSSDIWGKYMPSKYARNTWSDTVGSWMEWSTTGDNIWGWEWDSMDMNWNWMRSDRQWPCPTEYYIPSVNDYIKIYNSRNSANKINSYRWRQLSNDLLLPFAWCRNEGLSYKIMSQGTMWLYWSSSPSTTNNGRWFYFRIESSSIDPKYHYNRSYWRNIRCFKNSQDDKILRLHTNWWTKAIVAFTWEIWNWKIINLWDAYRNSGIFWGWYSDKNYENRVNTWDDVPTDLFIKRICPEWFIDNGENCEMCWEWYKVNGTATQCIAISYNIGYNLDDWVFSWENITWYTIESDDIILRNPSKTGYTFIWRSGTNLDDISTLVTIPTWSTWDREYEANWQINQYTITFKDWDNEITSITADYWTWITPPDNPTKNGYTFKWWDKPVPSTMPAEDMTIYAEWERNWSSGWWGGWSSSSKTDTGSTASWTTIKESETTTGSNTQTWSQVNSPEQTPQNDNSNTQDSTISSQNDGKRYSPEFQEAYEFAKWNGITTMPTIQKANMEWKLTRIAMAKMLSQYAMNVLWQKPANIVTPEFNDVTDKLNSDYDDWVTLAYQLWIMWQNMPWNNFRPNDEVTRAEFATALSRMAYWTSDWEYKWTAKYYIHHMEKLVREWIITNDDPNMKELRWYVMIMLMRSSK